MQIDLTSNELSELVSALDRSLERLQEEIVRTDDRTFREQLIATSTTLDRVRHKLSAAEVVANEFR